MSVVSFAASVPAKRWVLDTLLVDFWSFLLFPFSGRAMRHRGDSVVARYKLLGVRKVMCF